MGNLNGATGYHTPTRLDPKALRHRVSPTLLIYNFIYNIFFNEETVNRRVSVIRLPNQAHLGIFILCLIPVWRAVYAYS